MGDIYSSMKDYSDSNNIFVNNKNNENLQAEIEHLRKENVQLKQNLTYENSIEYTKLLRKHDYKLIGCGYDYLTKEFRFYILDLRLNENEFYSYLYIKTGNKPTPKELVCAIACLDRGIEVEEWKVVI